MARVVVENLSKTFKGPKGESIRAVNAGGIAVKKIVDPIDAPSRQCGQHLINRHTRGSG